MSFAAWDKFLDVDLHFDFSLFDSKDNIFYCKFLQPVFVYSLESIKAIVYLKLNSHIYSRI